tara:strand:+ start:6418 stop:6666 length:249 start_codon:yes stop_codon:yes gene_type:complete
MKNETNTVQCFAFATFSDDTWGSCEVECSFKVDADTLFNAVRDHAEELLAREAALELGVSSTEELRLESLHFEDAEGNEVTA